MISVAPVDIRYGTPKILKMLKIISSILPITPKPEVQSKFGKIQIEVTLPQYPYSKLNQNHHSQFSFVRGSFRPPKFETKVDFRTDLFVSEALVT